jgi:hypothetical protein
MFLSTDSRHTYGYKLWSSSRDLLLYSYEADFIQGILKKNEKKLSRSFNLTFRYIDDVLSLNNSRFGDFVDLNLHRETDRGGKERNFTTKKMISIFPFWMFHLYVATFQQHLHIEYISLSWYDIPELVVPIQTSLKEGCC